MENKIFIIKFVLGEWGIDKEYNIPIDSSEFRDYNDASLDHHIQLKIVEYLKGRQMNIHDLRYKYLDDQDEVIMENDKALKHGRYNQRKKND